MTLTGNPNLYLQYFTDNLVNLKILVVGDSGVGKSSLMLRYTDDKFMMDILPTVGLDFRVKVKKCITVFTCKNFYQVMEHKGFSVKLSVWDTAGRGKFQKYPEKEDVKHFRTGEVQEYQFSLLQRCTWCGAGV